MMIMAIISHYPMDLDADLMIVQLLYYDFMDDGYGGDEDAIVLSYQRVYKSVMKLVSAIIKPLNYKKLEKL
ncbi:MAG: hypothetical protein CM15mP108_2500 [Gammaproteobacteria bacterium]|nr:MAG: hypothetical protein CM15mP108_2500 [Gammaproteobacteria bacterium]